MRVRKRFKDLFFPHPGNNHKARVLHSSTLLLIVVFFLFFQFFLSFSSLVAPSVLGFATNITPEEIVRLTNEKRAENGLPPLEVNSKLNEAAQRKAGDMFAFNYWAHTSPSGRDPWSFFREVGYKYLYAGENLARDFMDSRSVVEAWMNSPTHRENILNPHYQQTGLAVVNGTLNGVKTTLVVQLFGTPLSVKTKTSGWAFSKAVPQLGQASATRTEEGLPFWFPFLLTKTTVVFLLGVVLGALLLDVFLVLQRRIVRLSGRNLAHLIFITLLLLTVIWITPGAIL